MCLSVSVQMCFLFISYPQDVTLSPDYGKAHYFKGPHDEIGGSVKRKVYQDVSSNRSVITSAEDFVQYAHEFCNSDILYLDKTDIAEVDVTNTVQYIYLVHFKYAALKE